MAGVKHQDTVPRDALLTDSAEHALVRARLDDAIAAKEAIRDSVLIDQVVEVARAIVAALRAGGKVVFFGNGGSSMDAGHLSAELMGRFAYDRPPLASLSLPDATAAVTAIGNDYSYADVFSRQLLGIGRAGDVVIGLTTSGTSANVVQALRAAREAGMVTVALTGSGGGAVAEFADHCMRVPSDVTARVQEACLHLGHSICELVEATMFPRPR
jgi:D-sedoheptulose 7-phosphate isomerase